MEEISVFGLVANITASKTFPNGFIVSAFADDGDPLDSTDLEVADTAMGPNGDGLTWSRPMMVDCAVNVIPQSQDDLNLQALVDANRVAKGKSSARDIIGIVWKYPNGMVVTLSSGKLVSGPVVPSGTSAGRMKSKRYLFRFEQVSRQTSNAQVA
jgi:hypothetical protein